MNVKISNKILSFILCIVLIAAMALLTTGCNDNNTPDTSSPSGNSEVTATVKGEGNTVFSFTVTDADGKLTAYEIHTEKAMVGEALLELGLIDGDDSDYGLYVKTVDGKTLDYDKDGMYWAFYENGKYAAKGVDMTEISAGVEYSFRAEK